MKLNTECNTDGSGYWSAEMRTVLLTEMHLEIFEPFDEDDEPNTWGELRVYFDQTTWRLPDHGLIYTDNLWIREFRKYLKSIGFSQAAVLNADYSEQGMQGDDYVSLDVQKVFIRAWKALEVST